MYVRIVNSVFNCIDDESRGFGLGRKGKIFLEDMVGGVEEKVSAMLVTLDGKTCSKMVRGEGRGKVEVILPVFLS